MNADESTQVLPGYEEDLDDDLLDDDYANDGAPARQRSRWRGRSGLVVNGVILLALLLVAAVTVWTVRGSDGDSGNAEAQTATVSTGDVTSTVSANGNIASGRTTNADFEGSGGIVTQIYVKAGAKVRKGQVLARVDQTSARQSLRTARASLASARASYSTTVQGQTAEERALDAQSVHQAEVSVSTARSNLRAAQQSLALTTRQQNAAVRRAEDDLEQAQKAHEANPTAETQQAVSQARTALTLARETRASSLLQSRQNVEAQGRSLTSAQASLSSTKASVAVSRQGPRSGTVEAAQAQITSAQVGVDQALTTLEQTTLRSPAAGTVAAVNGSVGEPSSATSAASSTSAEDSTSSATSSGGFVTLTNTKILQVTADVAEADIADVEVGQSATVTLSASDEEFAGTVTAVDTVETITNNVVEYGVTVTLDNAKGVKLGQSTQVVVTTGSTQGVLRVSSSALTTIGGRTTATVQAEDGTTSTVDVVTGLEGDGFIEVLDGLAEGDVVVLPEQAASTGGFTFPGGGGLGGLG